MKQRIFSVMITAAAAGLALSGCDSTPQATGKPAPPVKTTTSTSQPARPAEPEQAKPEPQPEPATPAAVEHEPDLPSEVLHPGGYENLKLGMSVERAKASGLLGTRLATENEQCSVYELESGSPNIGKLGRVSFGKLENGRVGLSTITIDNKYVHTPENVTVGSTPAQVRAAYPDATKFRGGLNNDDYLFLILDRGPNLSGIAIQEWSSCGGY